MWTTVPAGTGHEFTLKASWCSGDGLRASGARGLLKTLCVELDPRGNVRPRPRTTRRRCRSFHLRRHAARPVAVVWAIREAASARLDRSIPDGHDHPAAVALVRRDRNQKSPRTAGLFRSCIEHSMTRITRRVRGLDDHAPVVTPHSGTLCGSAPAQFDIDGQRLADHHALAHHHRGSGHPVTAENTAAGISTAVPTAAPTVPPTAPPTGPPTPCSRRAAARALDRRALCERQRRRHASAATSLQHESSSRPQLPLKAGHSADVPRSVTLRPELHEFRSGNRREARTKSDGHGASASTTSAGRKEAAPRGRHRRGRSTPSRGEAMRGRCCAPGGGCGDGGRRPSWPNPFCGCAGGGARRFGLAAASDGSVAATSGSPAGAASVPTSRAAKRIVGTAGRRRQGLALHQRNVPRAHRRRRAACRCRRAFVGATDEATSGITGPTAAADRDAGTHIGVGREGLFARQRYRSRAHRQHAADLALDVMG